MKTNNLTVTKMQTNHDIDMMIDLEHAKNKQHAYNSGKELGMKEPPLPSVKGDKLIDYIREIKIKYEQLALKTLRILCPGLQLPEGRMFTEWKNKETERMSKEIERLEKHIVFSNKELNNYNPNSILSRIRKANWLGVGLFIGEVALNTQAFQVTGDSMLSALILSISVSLAVCLGAHFAGRKYKDAKTKTERRAVLIISAIGITILSFIIASLRTLFFKKIGIDMNPLYFTIFNIVFFLIAAIATWYIYPSKAEMEANEVKLQQYKQLQKMKEEKKQREQELQKHEITANEKLSEIMWISMYAEHTTELIIRAYKEAVEVFKNANLLCRKEKPECFGDEIPTLDIPHITFYKTINKYKQDENKNNHENENTTDNTNTFDYPSAA